MKMPCKKHRNPFKLVVWFGLVCSPVVWAQVTRLNRMLIPGRGCVNRGASVPQSSATALGGIIVVYSCSLEEVYSCSLGEVYMMVC